MKKRFRNPATGETIILEDEGEGEESIPAGPKPAPSSGSSENQDDEKSETAEDKEPESGEDEGEKTGEFRTPFDFLDEIDGKDVEKVAIGAALGIGGMLALRGLFSFIARD